MVRIRDWASYWDSYPQSVDRSDYLRQIKYTVGGEPISASEVQLVIDEIIDRLGLASGDRLLDLCCGNGLVTDQLAPRCSAITGVDFSAPLLEVARSDHQRANVRYVDFDVADFDQLSLVLDAAYDKVLMSASLGYFRRCQLEPLLGAVAPMLAPGGVILLTSIPDRARRWAFYRTLGQRLHHVRNSIGGQDPIGTWWAWDWIEAAAHAHGLRAELLRSADPEEARYRFDARLQVVDATGPTVTNGATS